MSWKKVKLGDLCSIEKGKTGIQKAIPGEYSLVVTAEDRKSHNEYQFDNEAVIIPLVSGTGHGHASIKRLHFQTGKFALGSILCAVIPKDKSILNAEYLFRFLNLNKERELVDRMKGMANVTLPIKEIAKIEIPLPTLVAQIEFVKKYSLLEADSEDISSELEYQLDLIKQMRQAFLREAMQGILVLNNEQTITSVESRKRLIDKIEEEKGKKNVNKKSSDGLISILENDIPFDIPGHWVWTKIGDITNHNSGKTLDGGRNKGNKKDYITTSNLYWGYFKLEKLKQILIEDHELEKCTAKKGDLLVCEGGEAGRAAIWQEDYEICFQNHIHRIRPYSFVNSNFLFYFFNHLNLSGQINLYRKGMGISNISSKSLSSIKIPLPPLHEQEQIVAKLEELMTFCDELEQSIKESQGYNEKLLQQVLREALQG